MAKGSRFGKIGNLNIIRTEKDSSDLRFSEIHAQSD